MRKFVISDIHGNINSFKALLNKIRFRKEDELYLLGDFVDRGPDSKGVLDYIFQLKATGHQVFCTKGNHEDAMIKGKNDIQSFRSWLTWGGDQTLQSFNVERLSQVPNKYWEFLESLSLFIEVDRYILVHAGLNFDTPNPLDNTYSMMWIRNWYNDINYAWLGDRIIIHGHTPVTQDFIKKSASKIEENQYLDIDNGCFVDFKSGMGYLCALELGTHRLTFQKSLD